MPTVTLSEFFNDVFEPEFIQDAEVEYQLAQIAGRAMAIVEQSGLTRREIARRMGRKSTSAVQRLVGKAHAHNATAETLIRFAAACGYRADLRFVPLVATEWQLPDPQQAPARDNLIDMAAYTRELKSQARARPWRTESSAHSGSKQAVSA